MFGVWRQKMGGMLIKKLIWSFRFFTSFMYIYFDVSRGHLKLVEAADWCCVYIIQYEDYYRVTMCVNFCGLSVSFELHAVSIIWRFQYMPFRGHSSHHEVRWSGTAPVDCQVSLAQRLVSTCRSSSWRIRIRLARDQLPQFDQHASTGPQLGLDGWCDEVWVGGYCDAAFRVKTIEQTQLVKIVLNLVVVI